MKGDKTIPLAWGVAAGFVLWLAIVVGASVFFEFLLAHLHHPRV